MNNDTVEVLYSCKGCKLKKVKVDVPMRSSADVDVSVWVGTTMADAISRDHRERSPHCRATSMSDVMIPITARRYIGGPVEN